MFLLPDSYYTVKKTKYKGRGVFAAKDIEASSVIGDYLGKIIKKDSNDEIKDGLYDMAGGTKYDVLANPKIKGVHFINHSCANNCDVYPYKGHMLFFALRKIFKGEELSFNYWLYAPDEKTTTCDTHACYCESRICLGTMHHAAGNFDAWEDFVKKEFGVAYTKLPGKYGEQLPPLETYPVSVDLNKKNSYDYDIFGSEAKPAEMYSDAALPTTIELKKRIRETGKHLSFSKLHVTIYGIRDAMLVAERTNS